VRDLADLIGDEVREASTFGISEAQRLARVFVATGPYLRALATLERYAFVVLTGPPEMSRPRSRGLSRWHSWEAHECRQPDAGSYAAWPRNLPHGLTVNDDLARILIIPEPAGFEYFLIPRDESDSDPAKVSFEIVPPAPE
jgi:hypothetical protein